MIADAAGTNSAAAHNGFAGHSAAASSHHAVEAPLTVLGPDTHIKGEMFFSGSAQILGTFEGRITSKGEVFIGEGAMCKASVEAARVIVEGTVEGDITAHERAELHPSACVTGDLAARALIVAEGATFTGHFRVGCEPASVKPENKAERRAAGSVGAPVSPSVETRGARPVGRPTALAARAQRLAEAAADLDAEPAWQGA